jgi:excisionase family DNA binding protein
MDENALPGEGTNTCGLLLKVPEAAAILGVSRRTLYNWVSARLITSYKIGHSVRFKRSEIESLFEMGRRSPI